MRRLLLYITLILLLAAACSKPAPDENNGMTIEEILKEYQQPGGGGRAPENSGDSTNGEDQAPTSGPNCYGDDRHPIAASIADQFPAITDYEEVMVWFCNGALFEDILNALATEEITGVEAEATLRMVAEGFNWDEIWLELGVTEE